MTLEYINKYYGLDVRRGMRVVAYGKPGVVTGSAGALVKIRLDGHLWATPYHPTDGIEYGDPEMVKETDRAD